MKCKIGKDEQNEKPDGRWSLFVDSLTVDKCRSGIHPNGSTCTLSACIVNSGKKKFDGLREEKNTWMQRLSYFVAVIADAV